MKDMKKLAEARKPKIVFESLEYTISTIPLNYRIDINPKLKQKNHNAGIDRDCYSDLDQGIEKAHMVAKQVIQDYFLMPH